MDIAKDLRTLSREIAEETDPYSLRNIQRQLAAMDETPEAKAAERMQMFRNAQQKWDDAQAQDDDRIGDINELLLKHRHG